MTFIFPVSTIWWMVCILQYHSLGSFLILEYVWTMCISVKYYLLFFQVPNLSILLSLGSEFSIYWDEACLLWTGQMLSLASTSGFHANITNHQSSRICLKTSLIVLVVAISTGELQRLRTIHWSNNSGIVQDSESCPDSQRVWCWQCQTRNCSVSNK